MTDVYMEVIWGLGTRKSNSIFKFTVELIRRYFSDNVSKSGAQFAYFFLFSLFPLLIFINALFGYLPIELNEVALITDGFIPNEVGNIVTDYFSYLGSINSTGLMWTGLLMTLYLLSKAVNSLIYSINNIYHSKHRRHPIIQFLIAVLFSAILMLAIFLTLVILIFGRSFLTFIGLYIDISSASVTAWHFLRFVLLAAFFLGILLLCYAALPSARIRIRDALPGACFAMIAWIGVSIGLSYYVENMARFSLLYGSLGAVIVLMLWLYITGIVLILGSEVNYILMTMRSERMISQRYAECIEQSDKDTSK